MTLYVSFFLYCMHGRSEGRPVTSLEHQAGRRVFWVGSKFFKLCPIVLNYVQQISPQGARNFAGELLHPLRPWLRAWQGVNGIVPRKFLAYLVFLCFERRCTTPNSVAGLRSKLFGPFQNFGLAMLLTAC